MMSERFCTFQVLGATRATLNRVARLSSYQGRGCLLLQIQGIPLPSFEIVWPLLHPLPAILDHNRKPDLRVMRSRI